MGPEEDDEEFEDATVTAAIVEALQHFLSSGLRYHEEM